MEPRDRAPHDDEAEAAARDRGAVVADAPEVLVGAGREAQAVVLDEDVDEPR
jgi:hypothetical protein